MFQTRVYQFNKYLIKKILVSNSIWAFATVKFGVNPHSAQFDDTGVNNKFREDSELVRETLEVVARSSLKRLNRFRPQELNNLAWGFCKLGHYGGSMMELFEGVGSEVLRRHRHFSCQVSSFILIQLI